MRAFIIRPFGTKQEINFDEVERRLIAPALKANGVKGRTTIEILKQGNIRTDMFQKLLTADLVVADLSIHNANVFYELGIRHALRGRRTFLLRSAQDAYPFDLQTDRYLVYEKERPEAALPLLTEALRRTLASEDNDSPVFRELPGLEEQERSRFLAVPFGFSEEVERAKNERFAGDLGLLAAEAKDFEWESEGLRLVGRSLFRIEAFRAAKEVWEAIRSSDEKDLEANTMLGTIYQRLGDLTSSDQAVRRALKSKAMHSGSRAELFALHGRNAKALWKQAWFEQAANEPVQARREKALRSPMLERSYEAYADGFNSDLNHYYSGLNALAMLDVQIELAEALPDVWSESEAFEGEGEAERALRQRRTTRDKLAAAVELSLAAARQRLKVEGGTDIWVDIGGADLRCLTAKTPAKVASAYRKALVGAADFERGAARDQLEIYRLLEIHTENVEAGIREIALPDRARKVRTESNPRVLLFTGHRIDEPGRKTPRFPQDLESVVRDAIRKSVAEEQARPGGVAFGIAGGASGGDILFHEVCAGLGIETRLFLALPDDRFIAESVQPAGGDWVRRFDQLAAKLRKRVLAETPGLPTWLTEKESYGFWQRNSHWMLHNAIAEASRGVTLIALWDGQKGDGPGGTEDLIALAKERKVRTVVIDSQKPSA